MGKNYPAFRKWLKVGSFFSYMILTILPLKGTLSMNWCIVFNLSSFSSLCHWVSFNFSNSSSTTGFSGVKNIRLCPLVPSESVQTQAPWHKSIICIREMQEWANRISRVIYCASATAGRDCRGKRADVCLLMVASWSSQSPTPHTSVSQSVQLNKKG